MLLNVKHTVGSWKGTAIKFTESTDSSNGKFESTQYCLNYHTQVSLFLLLWKAPWQGTGTIHVTESFSLELLHSGLQDVLLMLLSK